MVTPAKRAANRAWDRANLVNLSCRVRREFADRVRAVAAENGDSINGIIKDALTAYLEGKEEEEKS